MTATIDQSPFHTLEAELKSEILERNEEIHTAVLATLSQTHHFQLGPPGTAKSLLVDRLTKRVDGLSFKTGEAYFRYLMTHYTAPEEIFGGPDFKRLRDDGRFKRITERRAPRASIAFLDEIFKGNSSILNALLTMMNERLFFNDDDDPEVPLMSIFSASNELPQGDELNAMWDRLHFRHVITPLVERSSLHRMLSVPMEKFPDTVVSLEDMREAHEIVKVVDITEDIYEAIINLRDELRSEGVLVTERRWVESMNIIRAEAWFNGRDRADIQDMRPLMHVLWTDLKDIKVVKSSVLALANPIDKGAISILDDLEVLRTQFDELLVESQGNNKQVGRSAVEIHKKLEQVMVEYVQLEKLAKTQKRSSEYLIDAKAKIMDLMKNLALKGFGVEPSKLKMKGFVADA